MLANPAVRKIARFFAQGFGSGKIPFAPGTFGTLVAIPIYVLLRELPPFVYALVVIGMFAVGVWFCQVTEQDLGKQDHASIVWDEIVGYLITMFMAPSGWGWVLLGFCLFRLFDIWKPFPIRSVERRVPGGLGVMLDDALAAVYALALMQITVRFING
ncbi:MAG: phosphatidylglycerophosphatase A [Gammaproteobacteria bacterium]|nr:phosphatidylglycerophosphatase A [Gammaproteobacteria bacterium]